MLDSKNAAGLFGTQPASMEDDESSTADTIGAIIGIVRRQIVLVVALAVLGSILGVVFLLNARPQFTGTTTLLINTHKIEIFQQPAVSDALPMQAIGAVENQVEFLRSDQVALRVINNLKLLDDPRFAGGIRAGFSKQLLHKFFPSHYSDTLTDTDRENIALKIIDDNLTVDRVGVTYAIEIKFRSADPGLAAEVANAVAGAYIDLQRSSEYDSVRRAADWLENRMPEMRAKSEAAQNAVVEYKKEHNILETSNGQSIGDQRLADMNIKLGAARDETLRAKTRSEKFAGLDPADLFSAPARGADGGGAGSDLFDKLRNQYFDIASKLTEASGHLGAANPQIVSLRNQEAQLRSEIMQEIQRLKQASEDDYAAAQKREATVRNDFASLVAQAHGAKEAQVKLHELEASAHAYQDLYNTYVSRYNESLQQAASPIAEASVITPATPLSQREYKKTIQTALLFPAAGLMLGLGVALLREMLSGRVFLTSKAVQSRLRIACIGLIPAVRAGKRMRGRDAAAHGDPDMRALVRGGHGISWTVVDRPFSQFTEGVRSIKFAVEMENRSRSTRVIGITSALPSEGKSTVSLAIAQMIASNGASTVLVDCDLRNPSLTRSIAPNADSGIVDLALGRTSLERVTWKDPSTHMAFIPATPCAGPHDPPSILSSAEMRHVFDKLREQYQIVIVDLPPLVPVVDVFATIDFIDAYVLVIEWGRTRSDIIKRALRAVPPVTDALIGAVLNKVDIKSLKTYDPYVTSYYFDNGDRQ